MLLNSRKEWANIFLITVQATVLCQCPFIFCCGVNRWGKKAAAWFLCKHRHTEGDCKVVNFPWHTAPVSASSEADPFHKESFISAPRQYLTTRLPSFPTQHVSVGVHKQPEATEPGGKGVLPWPTLSSSLLHARVWVKFKLKVWDRYQVGVTSLSTSPSW